MIEIFFENIGAILNLHHKEEEFGQYTSCIINILVQSSNDNPVDLLIDNGFSKFLSSSQ
jgi:hypothetical protein